MRESANHRLVREVHRLTKTLNKLQKEQPFDVMKNQKRFLWLSFLKGVMVGFGSFLGATILVALVVFLLSKIQFIPIIGDFVKDILQELSTKR